MTKIKKFFGIESSYKFEMMDLFALITVANVTLVLMGFWWAPIIGLINCGLSVINNIRCKCHINAYIMQVALIILNSYFLTL
jgi:hypothetical protein